MEIKICNKPENFKGKLVEGKRLVVLPNLFLDITAARAFLMSNYSTGEWIILSLGKIGAIAYSSWR